MPVEELLFFVVIPLCGLLTYNAVDGLLGRVAPSEQVASKVAGAMTGLGYTVPARGRGDRR